MYKKFRSAYWNNFSKVSGVLKYYRDFLKVNFGTFDRKEKVSTIKSETSAEKIDSTQKAFKNRLKGKYINESIALKYFNFTKMINIRFAEQIEEILKKNWHTKE